MSKHLGLDLAGTASSGLVDVHGAPLSTQTYRKSRPPKLGEAFGPWAGRDSDFLTLPGGASIAFDLSRLTLADYRKMTEHYQVNASLTVLMFMLYQLDWTIECDNKAIATHVEENLAEIWPNLVRAKAQAFWAGYSPNILQWDNVNTGKGSVQLTKVKDLIPEEARVAWKRADTGKPLLTAPGTSSNPFYPLMQAGPVVYDGIHRLGSYEPIPVECTYWYPLLMQNGDYYGKKLLKPAFSSWFFSILLHLFSNRYFERFGEPVPVGRAPYDETVDMDGKVVNSHDFMAQQIQNLRNRSVVILPDDSTQFSPTHRQYDYTLEYLESQMRGADFERYMTRLDEEISLALFTPLLMLRTADVGSYNLGVTHAQVYFQMLNAIAGDWAYYINNYILSPMTDYNFSTTAPRPKIKFRKLGVTNPTTLQAIMAALTSNGSVKFDMQELGQELGLSVTEVQQVLGTDPAPAPAPAGGPRDSRVRTRPTPTGPRPVGQPRATAKNAAARLSSQVHRAFKDDEFGPNFKPDLGYKRQFEEGLRAEGWSAEEASSATKEFYDRMGGWLRDTVALGQDQFADAGDFMEIANRVIENEVDRLADATESA